MHYFLESESYFWPNISQSNSILVYATSFCQVCQINVYLQTWVVFCFGLNLNELQKLETMQQDTNMYSMVIVNTIWFWVYIPKMWFFFPEIYFWIDIKNEQIVLFGNVFPDMECMLLQLCYYNWRVYSILGIQ